MGRACSMQREMSNLYKILVKNLEEKRPFGRPRCSFNWSRRGTSDSLCEHGNEPSGSVKGGLCLD
jgi:hypothetical protein